MNRADFLKKTALGLFAAFSGRAVPGDLLAEPVSLAPSPTISLEVPKYHLALYTSDGKEVDGLGYKRVTFTPNNTGSFNQIAFPEAQGPWGRVSGIRVIDPMTGDFEDVPIQREVVVFGGDTLRASREVQVEGL